MSNIKSFNSFNEAKKESGFEVPPPIPPPYLYTKKDVKKAKKDVKKAKTLKSLKEHKETQNYMFFGNLETMKRLVDELLTMDQSQIDSILNEHDWASDHISVATENLEQVFDFLAGHNSPEGMEEEPLIGGPESSHTVHDNHMRNMTSQEEEEVKGGIMGFEDFK